MLRARMALLIVILLVTGGLAACSSPSAAKPATTLTYWAANMTATPAQDAKVLEPELAKFEKQTGIKVRLQVQRWATLYSQLLTAIAGHQLPDVIDIGDTWSAALQATGAFQPFGASSLATLGGHRRFLATSLSSTGAAGQPPISIPLYGQAYGLFYNPAMFAAAGLDAPPTTWAAFIADAKKLTKPGQWGVALPGASSIVNAHMAFILGRQQGSERSTENSGPSIEPTPSASPGTRASSERGGRRDLSRHPDDPAASPLSSRPPHGWNKHRAPEGFAREALPSTT